MMISPSMITPLLHMLKGKLLDLKEEHVIQIDSEDKSFGVILEGRITMLNQRSSDNVVDGYKDIRVSVDIQKGKGNVKIKPDK